MLEVRDLRAGYGDVRVLHGVGLEVEPGEIVTLLGVNGAGKTTLLRAISGLIPSTGQVTMSGQDLTRLLPHRRVDAGLVQVPEGRQLFPELTVQDNLTLGGYSASARPRRAETMPVVLDLFPVLSDRLGQRAGTLSGGEQQMLAIGRGLLSQPKYLMLDEPSLGVAPVVVDSIMAALKEVASKGIGVLLVEQNAVQALEVADRVYVLDQGVVTGSGPAADYMDPARLTAAYLGTDVAGAVSSDRRDR